MKDIVLNFWTHGDRSVGMEGHSATVTLPSGCDAEYVQNAKELLTEAFNELFDDGRVHCATDEELRQDDEEPQASDDTDDDAYNDPRHGQAAGINAQRYRVRGDE